MAHQTGAVAAPRVEARADSIESFLHDAAQMPGGSAEGVVFPRSTAEVAASVAAHRRVLPVGAQSSLTGGATPHGGLLLSTRALNAIEVGDDALVHAGAGVPLSELRRVLAPHGLWYPPVPTFEGAFLGGTIATNAAGPATFKYGSTRRWVEALTIVLASGSVVRLTRGEVTASPDGWFDVEAEPGTVTRVPLPTYDMPPVAKLSAGYFAGPGMDLVDLFVGSEGTLGVIVDATLRTVAMPRRCVALITCDSEGQAVALAGALRDEAAASWRGAGPLDVAAIEYIDWRALACVPDEAFSRAGVARPGGESALLLVQIEMAFQELEALHRLGAVLDGCGVRADPHMAGPGDERGAARIFELREAVPAAVNALVAAAKARGHPDIQKMAADMVVPFDRVEESLCLYRDAFERRGLAYAIWGHLSDGNLHPNVIPGSLDDVERGREAILEIAQGVIAMGGAPLAEHGVGRSALKQRLLVELYGRGGVDEMRAVKRALDPTWKLAPGVILPGP